MNSTFLSYFFSSVSASISFITLFTSICILSRSRSIDSAIAFFARLATLESVWFASWLFEIRFTIFSVSIRMSTLKAWSSLRRFFSLAISCSVFRQKVYADSFNALSILVSVRFTTQYVETLRTMKKIERETRKSNRRLPGLARTIIINVIPPQRLGGESNRSKVWDLGLFTVADSSSYWSASFSSRMWSALIAVLSSGC